SCAKQVACADDIALENLALFSGSRGQHRRTVVNLAATANRLRQRRRISQITIEGFHIETFQRRVVAAFAQKRTNGMAVMDQATDEIGSEMTTRSCNQDHRNSPSDVTRR